MNSHPDLQFFAVIRSSDMSYDLRRVAMTHNLQSDLSRIFCEQAKEFLTDSTRKLTFSPSYTPQKDEIFILSDFALPEHLQRAVDAPQGFDEISVPFTPQAPMVKAILGVDVPSQHFYFQYFDRSRILKKDFTAIFRNGTFQKLDDPGITIDNHLTALIDSSKLVFRSFHRVRQFVNLDDFFKEATDDDIKTILSHEKLAVTETESILDSLSVQMRKRFSIVMATGILDHDKVTPERIQNRSKKFDGLDIKLVGKPGSRRICFPEDATTMGLFLRFLAEELYISELTDQAREANSSRPLD